MALNPAPCQHKICGLNAVCRRLVDGPPFHYKYVIIIKLAKSMTKKPRKCERCGERFKPGVRGRPQRFCSPSCRQATYFERRIAVERDPSALLARDLNTMAVRTAIRQELWAVLRQIGLVTDPKPPAPRDPPRPIIRETLIRAGLGPLLSPPHGEPDRR